MEMPYMSTATTLMVPSSWAIPELSANPGVSIKTRENGTLKPSWKWRV